MTNRTLERARKKARMIMDDLECEGMSTLSELKILLDREIDSRLGSVSPTAERVTASHPSVDRIFAQMSQPTAEEAKT